MLGAYAAVQNTTKITKRTTNRLKNENRGIGFIETLLIRRVSMTLLIRRVSMNPIPRFSFFNLFVVLLLFFFFFFFFFFFLLFLLFLLLFLLLFFLFVCLFVYLFVFPVATFIDFIF